MTSFFIGIILFRFLWFYFDRFLNILGGEGGCLDLFFIRLLTRDPSCLGIFYAEVAGSGYLLRISPPIQPSGGLFSRAV